MFGFFKKYDAHLCSAVSGQILLNGKPLVGGKVERGLNYIDDKKREDHTLTDEQGCFTMPAVNVRSKAPGWAFAEQLTMQLIYIEHNNKPYVLWSACLSGTEPVPAYDKKLKTLQADLSNPEVAFTFINESNPNVPHCVRSVCRWNDDFEILHIVKD
ncbi:DUF6795 domain-containing protein [Psychromonas aquimarina]|uniref:DUF6795 domain-containing protein n=1 Tax=Psychromonas aquimarina TaxID=444919 RepID=UPI0003FCFB58|nr:DUF6795 domain-containing protein [Psychromonas aquimarina]